MAIILSLFQLAQSLVILAGVGVVFAQGAGEIVGAVKLRFCTEVEVFALFVVQRGIYSSYARNANRCWWQTLIAICIKWRVHAQVAVEDAGERESPRAYFTVGQACRGIRLFKRFIYTPAIRGISPLFLVSS